MGLPDPFKLLQAAGFTSPVDNVTLRQPPYAGIKEPYLTYGLENRQFVSVGVNDWLVQRFWEWQFRFDEFELGSTNVPNSS